MEDQIATEEQARPVLYKFTNATQSDDLDMLIGMFVKGVMMNKVGIMQAYNLNTEEEDIILVGIELDENGKPDCYPLARALRSNEINRYLAPDGLGGFYDPLDATENAEVKERMKPYKEAPQAELTEAAEEFVTEVMEGPSVLGAK